MQEDQLTVIEGQRFGEERALYNSRGVVLKNCSFDGAEDGESALKESKDCRLVDCFCNLRYPFWHDEGLLLQGCELTPLCRAALWYSQDILIENSKLHGIKALRECRHAKLLDVDAVSAEFGWFCKDLTVSGGRFESEYFLLQTKGFRFDGVHFKGKYSFQYVSDGLIENCVLDTKDAFWHAKNVTVKNSTVRGEYLGWYSENLTLINCKIIGTQPLCYCKGLRLESCEMIDTDLSFEKSDVDATLSAPIVSIKNPRSGRIVLPSAGEIISDDPTAACEIVFTTNQ